MRLVPGVTAVALGRTSLPCIALTLSGDWTAEPTVATIAASLDAVVLVLNGEVCADEFKLASPQLAEDAALAVQVWPPPSVIRLEELLPYRPLAKMSRPELESLVRETLGGVLAQHHLERNRLVEALWARHQHDTDSAAVRALGIDPRTLRRRRDRVLELTGLDPARQRDRFRLDLGLHALRLLFRDAALLAGSSRSASPYPRESHKSGVRPNFGIAARSAVTPLFAPHSPHSTVDKAGREEHAQ